MLQKERTRIKNGENTLGQGKSPLHLIPGTLAFKQFANGTRREEGGRRKRRKRRKKREINCSKLVAKLKKNLPMYKLSPECGNIPPCRGEYKVMEMEIDRNEMRAPIHGKEEHTSDSLIMIQFVLAL